METTVANGKVALVTGYAMGIGLACAEAVSYTHLTLPTNSLV